MRFTQYYYFYHAWQILLYIFYKYFKRNSFTFLIVPLHFSSIYSGVCVNCYFGIKYRDNGLKGSITILLWPRSTSGARVSYREIQKQGNENDHVCSNLHLPGYSIPSYTFPNTYRILLNPPSM